MFLPASASQILPSSPGTLAKAGATSFAMERNSASVMSFNLKLMIWTALRSSCSVFWEENTSGSAEIYEDGMKRF